MNHAALKSTAPELAGKNDPTGAAWWSFGYLWMVLAGPMLAVVASFATLYLATSRPDPEVARHGAAKAVAGDAAGSPRVGALAPAVQGRNHAATGVPAPVVTASAAR